MKKKTLALSGHRVTLEAGSPFALKLNINSELHTGRSHPSDRCLRPEPKQQEAGQTAMWYNLETY